MLGEVSPREKLFADALALPESARIRLVRELLESFEHVELSPEDEAELVNRIDEIDRGGETIDGPTLLASLRGRHQSA